MGLIKKIIAKHKERAKVRNEACDNLIAQVDTAIQEINLLFSDSQSFVDLGKEIEWSNHNASLIADMNIINIQELKKTSVYKGYKRDKIEMRVDRVEVSDFPLYLNTVAGGLDCRDQTIGGFSFVVKIYAVPVVEIIG